MSSIPNLNKAKIIKGIIIDPNNHKQWEKGFKLLEASSENIIELTKEAYDHLSNCLPPLIFNSYSFIGSEAFNINYEGKNTYLAALQSNNKYYAQLGTVSQFKNKQLFKNINQ